MNKINRISLTDYISAPEDWLGKQPEFYALKDFDALDMDYLRVEFMRISPSYALICDEAAAKASKLAQFRAIFSASNVVEVRGVKGQLPSEFIKSHYKAVQEAFKEYEDINTSIFDWYRNIGRYIFDNWTNRRDVKFLGITNCPESKNLSNPNIRQEAIQYINEIALDEACPKTLLLTVPFDLPKAIALKHVQTLIEAHYDWVLNVMDTEYRQKKPLASKRERPDALVRKLKVLICKAFHPDMPLWKIGLLAGVSPKHELRMQDAKLSNDYKISLRPEIATLTSRALRQGQYIAEHAATDTFPVSVAIQIPNYDWDALKARILLAYPNLSVGDVLEGVLD